MMNYIGHLNYLKGCGIIPNFSELERLYNKDRRTLKKYYDNGGIPKRKKREYHSELDDYIEIIKSKFEEPGNTKKGIYEFLLDKYKIKTSYNNFKSNAMELLNVTTERQVAYYLSALLFLNYINHDKEFTEKAINCKSNEDLLKKDIYEQLISNSLFNDPYNKYKEIHRVNVDELKVKIGSTNPGMAESTVNCRASTIRAWVEWMYEYDMEKNNLLNN